MVSGIKLLKENKADAFISAGNTGAQLAASRLILGKISHVKRPGLAVYFQALNEKKILCDVGANLEVRPEHLLQFAIMSTVYLDHVEGIKNPKIGLINIGEEPSKGTEIYQQTYELLSKELPNFVGNIESRNFFDSQAHVLVCDGFVGNTIMKFAEGCFTTFSEMVRKNIMSKARYKIGAGMIKPALDALRPYYDFEEHGGTPFLGVNGISISCHGASTAKAIMNSIFLAEKSIKKDLINDISIGIDKHLGAIS
jgi:glycerol-3-phosphate acyltransferase PlsX